MIEMAAPLAPLATGASADRGLLRRCQCSDGARFAGLYDLVDRSAASPGTRRARGRSRQAGGAGFLVSLAARHITGERLMVDAGLHLHHTTYRFRTH